ncbi:MAG: hypothetical protein AB7E85_06165 [Pseudobdellovibrionaceae bacterium]
MNASSGETPQKSGASWREKQAASLRENLKKRKLMMKARQQNDAADSLDDTLTDDEKQG